MSKLLITLWKNKWNISHDEKHAFIWSHPVRMHLGEAGDNESELKSWSWGHYVTFWMGGLARHFFPDMQQGSKCQGISIPNKTSGRSTCKCVHPLLRVAGSRVPGSNYSYAFLICMFIIFFLFMVLAFLFLLLFFFLLFDLTSTSKGLISQCPIVEEVFSSQNSNHDKLC